MHLFSHRNLIKIVWRYFDTQFFSRAKRCERILRAKRFMSYLITLKQSLMLIPGFKWIHIQLQSKL
jgi:hypothetical protein